MSGDVRGALEAYERAEGLMAGATLLVPLGEGRSTFAATAGASARGRVELMVVLLPTEIGMPAKALLPTGDNAGVYVHFRAFESQIVSLDLAAPGMPASLASLPNGSNVVLKF